MTDGGPPPPIQKEDGIPCPIKDRPGCVPPPIWVRTRWGTNPPTHTHTHTEDRLCMDRLRPDGMPLTPLRFPAGELSCCTKIQFFVSGAFCNFFFFFFGGRAYVLSVHQSKFLVFSATERYGRG